MIKPISQKPNEVYIDLTGPEGNAFHLLGLAKKWGDALNMDTSEIISQMRSGDYENLVSVFDKYFGHFVTLYR